MRLNDRMSRPLLYEEVVKELYQIIDQDKIEPGDKLPSERELTERLGISRNVLREAFHVLESRGIIVSRQGSGRFLRQLPQTGSAVDQYESMSRNLERYSLQEAYEVRQVLEVKAVELIIRNANEEDLEELKQTLERLKKRFELTHNTVGEFDLHRLYAKKTGSMFMEQTLSLVLSTILDMMSTTFYDILVNHQTESEVQSHERILDAICRRDTETAKAEMFRHIQDTIDML